MRDRFVGNDRGSVQRVAERKETAKRVPRHREHIKEFKRKIKKDDESARRSVAGKFFEATTSERRSARGRRGKVFATTPTRKRTRGDRLRVADFTFVRAVSNCFASQTQRPCRSVHA